MKKTLVLLIAMFAVFAANAQERVKIKDGLYLVSYGNTAVIEDDVNNRTISMSITKEINDRNSAESTYNVVCGKWTKRAVKDSLKTVIAAGIVATAATQGASAIVSAAATIANYIYDDACEYYGEKYK
ncbi:MAG: hypothetical protein IJ622_00915 [Bacteroidales bacterium]|nr:hypothetical protein [Bacteroidales bacterium]